MGDTNFSSILPGPVGTGIRFLDEHLFVASQGPPWRIVQTFDYSWGNGSMYTSSFFCPTCSEILLVCAMPPGATYFQCPSCSASFSVTFYRGDIYFWTPGVQDFF
jgi:hypothetical protein